MKTEYEKLILDEFYKQKIINKKRYFRFNEISKNTGIGKSSLQKPLQRLVKRGWIEKITTNSISENNLTGGIFHIPSYKERQNELYKEAKNSMIFSENVEQFKKKLSKSHPNNYRIDHNEYAKILRRGRIKNRTRIWKKTTTINQRQHIFYLLKEYPYLYRSQGGFMKKGENTIMPWIVPLGKKRFWKSASCNMKKNTKEYVTRLNIPIRSIGLPKSSIV